MKISNEIKDMCPVKKGAVHDCAPIPQEGGWSKVHEISQINGFTHGIGRCAPQQGACKLSLNVKNGIIEEALVETIGCSGMTQSAAMACEILPGKTILEALNTDLVCDAINVAMRELFLQIVYGRSQSAFSEDGLEIGAGLEDLKNFRSQVGTCYSTREKGPRYLELDTGYVTRLCLSAPENGEIMGYEYINFGALMKKIAEAKAKGGDVDYAGIFKELTKTYGQFSEDGYIIDAHPILHKEGQAGAGKMHFAGEERRAEGIAKACKAHGLKDLDEAAKICKDAGIDIHSIVGKAQSDALDDAIWAYILGTAIAIKEKAPTAADAARLIGEGLQAFCIPGSVAANRRVGEGHGNLGEMLLTESTKSFAFLAGHESFAAASGAIKLAKSANRGRKSPLKVILNGLGKDAAYIIARINGFTFVETEYDHATETLKITNEIAFSKDPDKSAVRCYGADDVDEGKAIMIHEDVDVSITGNSTNPTRFQHPVAGTYKKWCVEHGKKYFSVASGGGTGRTLHPDNMAAGPASYGLTDTMGRMHSDAQFAGSSSVAAHVEMMGYIGMGNNPMVGVTVECAVLAAEAVKRH